MSSGDVRKPGPGSGETVDDGGSRVLEGRAGKGSHSGGKEGVHESAWGAGGGEGDKSAQGDKGSNGEECEQDRGNIGNGEGSGLETFFDYMPLVHVGRSFRLAVSLALLLGLTVAAFAPWAWVIVATGIAIYPVSAAVFFLQFRRAGPRSGPPSDMGPVCLGLIGVSLALVVLDSTALSGLFVAALVIFLCGMSTGEWLAVVAVRRKTGLRGALVMSWRLDGRARKRAWAGLVEGRL